MGLPGQMVFAICRIRQIPFSLCREASWPTAMAPSGKPQSRRLALISAVVAVDSKIGL